MAFKDWTLAQRQALTAELALTIHAGPPEQDDASVAAALNDRVIDGQRASVSGSELFNAIDPGEFVALAAAVQQRVRDVFSLGDAIDIRAGTNTRAVLLTAFPAGSATRASLIVLVTAKISRAEQMDIPAPHHLDIAAARGRV